MRNAQYDNGKARVYSVISSMKTFLLKVFFYFCGVGEGDILESPCLSVDMIFFSRLDLRFPKHIYDLTISDPQPYSITLIYSDFFICTINLSFM